MIIDYPALARRVRRQGSIALLEEEISVPVAEFRRELRRAARAAGLRILTSRRGGDFIAWDPEFTPADPLDVLPSTQPTCPEDGTLMRDHGGGWICGACGHHVTALPPTGPMPVFTGRAIKGG